MTQLPRYLLDAIEKLAASVDRKVLMQAAFELSSRYRSAAPSVRPYIQTKQECLAYLCTRFPATYSANHAVFLDLNRQGKRIETILDLGAGSGAAMWAALQVFKDIKEYVLLERDLRLIEIGKELLQDASFSKWVVEDYAQKFPEGSYDLVVLSYTLGEVDSKHWPKILEKALEASKEYVVIIEPGTPVGYGRLMQMRDILIRLGASIVSPCPHSKACPMKQGDWCHFSQRLPRTSLHKSLKEASLGFEDEKFSYIAVTKHKFNQEGFRVIRHPLVRSGYVEWIACSSFDGIIHKKASKKQKEIFKEAKELSWGSFYEKDL